MKINKICVFIALSLLSGAGLQAGIWEAMLDAWSKINKNAVAMHKRQPTLTKVIAVTALVSGLGFLLWKATELTQVIGHEHARDPNNQSRSEHNRCVIAAKDETNYNLFNRKKEINILADLPGVLQEELSEDHDWMHTAVMFKYEGTLVHNTYNLSNGKSMKFLSYEGEDVKDELFQTLRQEYRVPDGMTLPVYILTKYNYCAQQDNNCLTYQAKPVYIEKLEDIELGIAELSTKGASVGVYSKNHTLTVKEKQMLNNLGIKVGEQSWYSDFLGHLSNDDIRNKHDMFILVDNNENHISEFLKKARQLKVSAVAFFYNRAVPMTIDTIRAEIRDIDPNIPCHAAGLSD